MPVALRGIALEERMCYFYKMRSVLGKYILLLALLFSFGLSSAQITYIDSYYQHDKRLVHVQQPLDFETYSYYGPLLLLTDFKQKNPAAHWLPDSMRVTPPWNVSTEGAAWSLSVIQKEGAVEGLPILLFIANYDSVVSPVYADRNLNGDFNDDGAPLMLIPGRIPEPIDVLSKAGVTYRIHLQAIAAVAPRAAADTAAVRLPRVHQPRWRLGLTGHFGVGQIDYSYHYLDGTRIKTRTYEGPSNFKGLTLTGEYTHGAFGLGLRLGFDHIFYWASTSLITYSTYVCPTGEPCAWIDDEEVVRAKDQLPNLRIVVGPRLSWLPRVGKDIRLGPVFSPGFMLSPKAYYQPDLSSETTYRLGRQFAWEAGLQVQFENVGGTSLVLGASAFQSEFQPDGYFEAVRAEDLKVSHLGMRFSVGVGLWK